MKMALERLEPCAMKVARTVLRRVVTGDSHGLSDSVGLQTPKLLYISFMLIILSPFISA